MSGSRLGLTRRELADVLGLSGVFALRLLGLFLLLPVLSVYALGLPGATAMTAGLAVGIYGLSQTIFQVPMGWISDRWGRRPTLTVGLLVYAAGCVLAARTNDPVILLIARFVQGAGAVASVIVAMIADRTRDEVRGRAMACVGIAVGLSFAAGFLFGPPMAARFGVPAIFSFMAVSGVLAVVYLWTGLPEAAPKAPTSKSLADMVALLKHPDLVRLDIAMFFLHLSLTAVFVVAPVLLEEHWTRGELWKVYVPMLVIGGGLMLPAMALAEKRRAIGNLVRLGIFVCAAGFGMLWLAPGNAGLLVGGLVVYFVGFNFIEPALPSMVTRFAPESLRGTAVGVFNMSQFLGAFCGGVVGGYFLGAVPERMFLALALACMPWLSIAWGLSPLPERAKAS